MTVTAAEAEADLDAVREFLDRHGVHTVECMFADTWGIPRGKRLSTQHFLSTAGGLGFAMANVEFATDRVKQTFRVMSILIKDHASWRIVQTQWSNGGRRPPMLSPLERGGASGTAVLPLNGAFVKIPLSKNS